jgi:hypothetical protein
LPSSPTIPTLRPAHLSDYEQIRKLGLLFSLDVPPEEDWRRLWLDNPLRDRFGDELPLGWILEDRSGGMVGTMGTALSAYTLEGTELISAVSRAWFVTDEYRAFAMLLMDEYLNQESVDLHINNAVSVPALSSFQNFCRPVPLGEWDYMSYWVTGDTGATTDALNRLSVSLSGEQRRHPVLDPNESGLATRSVSIEITDTFDARFDTFWKELIAQNPHKLLADRSTGSLSWHFGAPMRHGRLWIVTATRRDSILAYCTLTRQDCPFQLPALSHDRPKDIPTMRLADYQTIELEFDLLRPLLAAAIDRCWAEDIYILENLGRGVPKMRAADNNAPFYSALSNWKYFYSARSQDLQALLEAPERWDPSAYDGDASFE